MSEFALHILTVAAIYGVLAVSLSLQAGTAGLMNFGQVAFFGLGGYAAAVTSQAGGPFWLGALIGILLAASAGALVGRLGRNLDAEYWAIATLGLAEILRIIATNEAWLTGGAGGIGGSLGFFDGVREPWRGLAVLGVSLASLIASLGVAARLTRGQFGRVLRLMREQPDLPASFGHDLVWLKVRAMIVGGIIAAAGGALYTGYIAYISPIQLVPFETFLIWTMIIIGGSGNHAGAALGALLVQLVYIGALFLKDVLGIPSELAGGLRVLLIGCVLLAFLMLRPGGMLPEKLRRIHAPG